MTTFWDNPRELLIDGLFDAMPETAKKLFEEGVLHLSSGYHREAVLPILSCLNLVISQFARSVSDTNDRFNSDEAMSILQQPSVGISSDLCNRLEFIRFTYSQPGVGPERGFTEHEVEYLIVACIDVCERMLSDDHYRPTMLN
jgi:hypothetical protein